jgi:TolB protein
MYEVKILIYMKYIQIATLCAVVFVGCKSASEKPSVELRIVYNVYYDTLNDDYEIFSMNLDGSDKRNISNSKGVDWVYYAYKDKVYFISDRDTTHRMYFLYEMDAYGNNVRKVTDLRLEDSWLDSRDNGNELIVAGRIDKEIRHQLFLVNTKTGNYTPFAHDTAASFNSPVFSPDESKIVFRYRKNKRNFRTEKTELWMMDAVDGNMKQLTSYSSTDTTAQWHDYHAGPPFWEPNKNVITYMSMQKANYSIFSIHPDGTGVKQLTKDDANEGWHAWSPDGQWITYDGSDLSNEHFDIYLMRWDGSEVKKISDDWRTEQAPIFAEVKK